MFENIRQMIGVKKVPKRQIRGDKELANHNPLAKLPPIRSQQPPRHLPPTFQKGDRLGVDFHVYGILGEGGFGVVLLVYDFRARQVCALKTFRDDLLAHAKARESFRQEASRWIEIGDYPFILTARSIHEISNRLFVRMDFIPPDHEGRVSLAHYLCGKNQATIEHCQQLEWGIQFCLGMEHAHKHGIRCHRDIKPQNILITDKKALKISDFGLALVAENSSAENKHANDGGALDKEHHFSLSLVKHGCKNICGTPGYIPPEIYRGELGDIRSDIYSFGLVLWQMAANSSIPPFANNLKGNLEERLQMIYDTQMVAVAPPVSGQTQSVITKCLAKDPSNRYQTFGELREDLETLLWREFGKTVETPRQNEENAKEIYRRAVSLCTVGRKDEALMVVDQGLQIAPQDMDLRVFRSRCLFELGRTTEALQSCDELVQTNPGHLSPLFAKAIMLDKLCRPAEALPLFEQAVARMPNHFEAWQGKFSCLMVLGRFEKALECCERVLELQPKAPASWSQKADSLIWLNRFQEALICCDQALACDPQYANAWLTKGITLSRLNQFSEAISCYDKAIKIDGNLSTAWAEKGMVFFSVKRDLDALSCFDRALEIDPSFTNLWYRKGLVQEKLEHFPEAIESFSRFLRSAGSQDAQNLLDARNRLERLKVLSSGQR